MSPELLHSNYSSWENIGKVTEKRLLIIENDDDIREVAKLGLELTTNWEVLAASSRLEGLALAEVKQPSAIVLGIEISNPGLAILQQLKANPATQSIPVILMTDRARLADKQRFTQLGVAAVIDKPFDPVNLARQIAQCLK